MGWPKGLKRGPRKPKLTVVSNNNTESTALRTEDNFPPSIPNELSDEQLEAKYRDSAELIFDLKERIKDLNEEIKIIKKEAKKDGLRMSIIDELIASRTTAGQDKLRAKLDDLAKVARWQGLPVGTQADMFAEPDRRTADELARHRGRSDAMAGKGLVVPSDLTGSSIQAYSEGYHAGAEIRDSIRPGPTLLRKSQEPDERRERADLVAAVAGFADEEDLPENYAGPETDGDFEFADSDDRPEFGISQGDDHEFDDDDVPEFLRRGE